MSHRSVSPGEVQVSVDVEGTGMFAVSSTFGVFDLVLSGPPGGTLSFVVWTPGDDERDTSGFERAVRRVFRLQNESLTQTCVMLAGRERDAVCFVQSKGFQTVGWCAVRIEEGGKFAHVAFGRNVARNAPMTWDAILEHPSLSLVARSLATAS